MGYSLRVNHKKLAGASNPNRDQQFRHITALRISAAPPTTAPSSASIRRRRSSSAGSAQSRRQVGPQPRTGQRPRLPLRRRSGLAVPYGIYDPRANAGTVFVGRTADTPAFAVDCIEKWWRTEGRKRYPEAKTLQILADGGGSNSCTARAWKFNLQHRLCNRHGLRVRRHGKLTPERQ